MTRILVLVLVSTACQGVCPGGDTWAVDESFSYTLDPGDEACFYVPETTSPGLQLRTRTEQDIFGNVGIFDGEDEYFHGHGWCCVVPNLHSTLLADGDVDRANHVVFGNMAAAGSTTAAFEWIETRGGGSVAEAVPFFYETPGWNANNVVLDAGESVFFFMQPGAGTYRLFVEGMDWSEVKAPANAVLFTDAADPEGSTIGTCDAQPVDAGQRYVGECSLTLPADNVFMRVDQAGEGVDVLFAIRLEPA